MILRLKTRESRSLPGLPITSFFSSLPSKTPVLVRGGGFCMSGPPVRRAGPRCGSRLSDADLCHPPFSLRLDRLSDRQGSAWARIFRVLAIHIAKRDSCASVAFLGDLACRRGIAVDRGPNLVPHGWFAAAPVTKPALGCSGDAAIVSDARRGRVCPAEALQSS